MRKFLFTLILLLAGYIGYMYYFGKGEDKSKAVTIVNETKDLGKAVGDFLRKQKDKYDAGDFDQLIDKVNTALEKLKSKSEPNEVEVKDNLRHLENELRQIDPQKLTEEQREALKKLMDDVNKELDQ
jgi:translation initiation factor 2B subunit (eIF-2B alpha/beta/delta family)